MKSPGQPGARPAGMVLLAAIWLLGGGGARAGFTETLPQDTFMLDEAFIYSWIDSIWDNNGTQASLIEPVVRYEPGGGEQGVISARPVANYYIVVNQLQYGLLDELSVGLGIPVVIETKVTPNLSWEPGDYQRQIGRKYSEQDFWDWAGSMGQPKPTTWIGNKGTLSDMVIGLRYQFTHRIPALNKLGLRAALSVYGMIPTGKHADPEQIMSIGTTLWDLQTQGDLAIHLSADEDFAGWLDGRLAVGLDVFYEVFFNRTLTSATGEKSPLLLNQRPYVGETYQVKPGDYSGVALQITGAPYRGPVRAGWLSGGSVAAAEKLPPMVTASVRYTFVFLQQTYWHSDFEQWDWDHEKLWRPGYKNILDFRLTVSLLRIGVPLSLYFDYRSLKLIPGKNCRSAEYLSVGLQVPLKFW